MTGLFTIRVDAISHIVAQLREAATILELTAALAGNSISMRLPRVAIQELPNGQPALNLALLPKGWAFDRNDFLTYIGDKS